MDSGRDDSEDDADSRAGWPGTRGARGAGRPGGSTGAGRRRSSRRGGYRLRNVRDRRAARRWFVVDVVFVVGALVAIVVFWTVSSDNALGGALFTAVALAAIANALWEMRGLWPVTGWSAETDQDARTDD